MQIEYEATFPNINKDEMRERLKKAGALLVRPEFLQKRIPFHLPKGKRAENKFIRVRDEGNKITLSYKAFHGDKIEDQKELCLEVNNFDEAVNLLELLGCEPKSYQESKRELWKLNGVEITIDEWPFLEPYVEVEGHSEEEVKNVSEKLGFDWNKAKFCAAGALIAEKHGITEEQVNDRTPKIVFDMENPYI
ncbi:MAG: CYTH domain-containing protein [Candidatus Paceibacterota bacterium]|jgi:adenylate cyclase class 2